MTGLGTVALLYLLHVRTVAFLVSQVSPFQKSPQLQHSVASGFGVVVVVTVVVVAGFFVVVVVFAGFFVVVVVVVLSFARTTS